MVIAIDFDGTCVTHAFPRIGKEIGAIPVLLELQKYHHLILYTMRFGKTLLQAVEYLKSKGVKLYAVQYNPRQKEWTSSNKCHADLYIDDCGACMPMIFDNTISDSPFVDWKTVAVWLQQQGYLPKQ